MNEFQKRALDLLDELLAAPATKRFTRLLPCPQSDSGAIEKGLRDLPWSEGWAFDVQDSMASRLDILYTPRSVQGQKTALWTQGKNFDFSNTTFHGQGEHAGTALQVLEWRLKKGDAPSSGIVSVYSVEGERYEFKRSEQMMDVELLRVLISGLGEVDHA